MNSNLLNKILLVKSYIFLFVIFTSIFAFFKYAYSIEGKVNEFWPPDMIPHPQDPSEPKGPKEPDMVKL